MKKLTAPRVQLMIVSMAIVLLYVLSATPNAWLWAACLLSVPAIVFLAGGSKTPPVLILVLGISWLQIAAIVAIADLQHVPLQDLTEFGGAGSLLIDSTYLPQAVLYSLCAMLAVAFGIRCGDGFGAGVFVEPNRSGLVQDRGPKLKRLVIGYGVTLIFIDVIGGLLAEIPHLTQYVVALSLVKYVFVYLVAATVIETRRGYGWLFLVAALETGMGALAYFSSFKQAIFVIIVAVIAARRSLNARLWLFAAAAVVIVVWMSLVWTEIKGEFRSSVVYSSLGEKIEFVADKYLSPDIDIEDASSRLLARIEYTSLFSRIIQLDKTGMLPETHYYEGAVLHILTPRILFPDKKALDDSKKTAFLTGQPIAKGTSIGVGYVAEAYADFGFPGLLLPMFAIGGLLGLAARYFMTRRAPLLVRQGLTTAALFWSFIFEGNIDKNLGAFITNWLVLAIAFGFGYPLVARWLGATYRRPRSARPGVLPSEIPRYLLVPDKHRMPR